MMPNDNHATITVTKTAGVGWAAIVETIVLFCRHNSIALNHAVVDLDGFSRIEVLNIADAFSDLREKEISEFKAHHCPYMLEMIEDVRAEPELYLTTKPQPFWTQQGRHKKGGRGRY